MAIGREDRNGIALLRMERGKVNALDLDLLEAWARVLNELRVQPPRAVVVTGNDRAFSAGVDLYSLLDGGRDYVERFLPTLASVLVALFTLPVPTVAAVNGHAIAGGFLLAAACDYRLMAEGKGKVGVTELKVGVPFPAIGLELVRHVARPEVVSEMVYRGGLFPPDQARAMGLVHELTEPPVLEAVALERAEELAGVPTEAFWITKRQLQAPTLGRFREIEADLGDEVTECWLKPASWNFIRGYLEKTVGKR